MELNREQIIRALEDCINRPKCIDCPNLTLCSGHGFEYLLVQALELIKQLTEENERLQSCVMSEEQVKTIAETTIKLGIDTIKADTVRKMQERLKARKFTHKNFGELVYVEDMDQIAKEMLEGADERYS